MPRFSALSLLPLFVCAALLQLPAQCVLAQGDEHSEPEYYLYTAPGWGVSILLADDGAVGDTSSPDWEPGNLDWLWTLDDDSLSLSPIYRIEGITVGRDSETPDGVSMSGEELDIFYEEMLATLAEDANVSILESDPNYVTSTGQRWQMFHIEEYSEEDDWYYYYFSLFTTDNGVLRYVSFYYDAIDEEDELIAVLEVMEAIDPGILGSAE